MQTPDGITANTVIESYLEAIGWREKLNEVYSLIELAEATMQVMNLEIVSQKNNQ